MSAAETVTNILNNSKYKNIVYDKMTYSRKTGLYCLFLLSDKKINKKDEIEIKAYIGKELSVFFDNIEIYIKQPSVNIFEDDEVSEVKYVFYKDLEKMVDEKVEGLLIHEEEYTYLFKYIGDIIIRK